MIASTQANDRIALASAEYVLNRVKIKNYKSIGRCDVALKPLTILVGRNGSGKSNVLDALRFVVDGLRTTLDHAIKSRGGRETRKSVQWTPRAFKTMSNHLDMAGDLLRSGCHWLCQCRANRGTGRARVAPGLQITASAVLSH